MYKISFFLLSFFSYGQVDIQAIDINQPEELDILLEDTPRVQIQQQDQQESTEALSNSNDIIKFNTEDEIVEQPISPIEIPLDNDLENFSRDFQRSEETVSANDFYKEIEQNKKTSQKGRGQYDIGLEERDLLEVSSYIETRVLNDEWNDII